MLELKSTTAEMKNSLEGFNSRIPQVEEENKKSANLKTYQLRLSYLSNKKKKKKEKKRNISRSLREPQDTIKFQFSSVTQLCPTLCDPMNRSTPGLPVHYQLPEFTQTHVH